jgi:hypothetical protein
VRDGAGSDPPDTEETHVSVSLAGKEGGSRLDVITDHHSRPP